MNSIRARLAKGTIWISSARIAVNLLNFGGILILARILIPADFGLAAIATTLLTILNGITEISLSEALIQHKSPTSEHFSTAWTFGIIRAICVSAVFLIIAAPAAHAFGEPRLFDVILVLSGGIIIKGATNPKSIILTKDLIFWQQFLLQVGEKFVTMVATIAIAIFYRSYWALILGTISGQFFGVIASYFVIPFLPRIEFRHRHELFSFSIWLTLGQVANTINWKFDQLLVGRYLGSTKLGFYTVGDNLAVIPSRETTVPLTVTLFPAFVKLVGEPDRLSTAYQAVQSVVTAVALPAGVGVALLADPLVRVTMGTQWLPAVQIIQVLSTIYALQTLGSLAQPLAMAHGKTKRLFKRDMQAFLMRLPLVVAGMYLGALSGILWARAVAGLISILFNMAIIKEITGLTIIDQVRPNVRSMMSALLMASVVEVVYIRVGAAQGSIGLVGELIGLGILGTFSYIFAHAALWMVTGKGRGVEREFVQLITKLWKSQKDSAASTGEENV